MVHYTGIKPVFAHSWQLHPQSRGLYDSFCTGKSWSQVGCQVVLSSCPAETNKSWLKLGEAEKPKKKQDKLDKKGQADNLGNGPCWFFCQMSFQLVPRRNTAQFLQAKKCRLPAKFENGGCLHLFSHFQHFSAKCGFKQNIHPTQVKQPKQSSPHWVQSLPWLDWKWSS